MFSHETFLKNVALVLCSDDAGQRLSLRGSGAAGPGHGAGSALPVLGRGAGPEHPQQPGPDAARHRRHDQQHARRQAAAEGRRQGESTL